MGTSSASAGPGKEVPLVPPWVDEPEEPESPVDDNGDETLEPPFEDDGDETLEPAAEDDGDDSPEPPAKDGDDGSPGTSGELAPERRFSNTRLALGKLAAATPTPRDSASPLSEEDEQGETGAMEGTNAAQKKVAGERKRQVLLRRKALKGYVRRGYGGAKTATRRMHRTARTAGRLYTFLSKPPKRALESVSLHVGFEEPLDLKNLSNPDIIDLLIEAVCPGDGSLDTERARESILNALSETAEHFSDEEVDFLNLTPEQIVFAVGRFIAAEVFRQLHLDVGESILNKAPSSAKALAWLDEIRDYITELVTVRFDALVGKTGKASERSITQVTKQALRETYKTFEEYTT